MAKATKENIERVLTEYFKYPRHSRLGREYKFSVFVGWSYEDIIMYAYDAEFEWSLAERITAKEIADFEKGQLTFGEAIGKHITILESRLYEHEAVFLKGYH